MTEEQKRHKAVVDFAMGLQMRDKSRTCICPHPATLKVYKTNVVNIFVCQMCKYAVHYPWTSAISCGYEENKQEDKVLNEQ